MTASLPPSAFDDEPEPPEPPRLRALRRLVTALTAILALGMIVIAGTIAWRLAGPLSSARPVSAEALILPEGHVVEVVGGAGPEIALLTRDAAGVARLLIYRRSDGVLLSSTPVIEADGATVGADAAEDDGGS